MSVTEERIEPEVVSYRVLTNHVASGVTVSEGQVIEASPPLDWCVGKSLDEIRRWAEDQGGKLENVEE